MSKAKAKAKAKQMTYQYVGFSIVYNCEPSMPTWGKADVLNQIHAPTYRRVQVTVPSLQRRPRARVQIHHLHSSAAGPSPAMAGRQRPQTHSPSASTRRRERWLVVLGVALHAVFMLSIFDIYFKSPIVHGMAPVPPRLSAPSAKRLVLVVGESPFVLLIEVGRVI
jgi:hypothetical protein